MAKIQKLKYHIIASIEIKLFGVMETLRSYCDVMITWRWRHIHKNHVRHRLYWKWRVFLIQFLCCSSAFGFSSLVALWDSLHLKIWHAGIILVYILELRIKDSKKIELSPWIKEAGLFSISSRQIDIVPTATVKHWATYQLPYVHKYSYRFPLKQSDITVTSICYRQYYYLQRC